MELINRRQTRVLIIAAVLVAIIVPVTLAKSGLGSNEDPLRDSSWARLANTTLDGSVDSAAWPRNRLPEARNWSLAAADEIVAEQAGDKPDTALDPAFRASQELVVPSVASMEALSRVTTPQMEPAPGPAENRSVVGWSSASITNYQPEQRITPASLQIPSLSINARVDPVGKESSGAMEIPEDKATVGWYKHGPSPGEPGNAVIAGHLDDAYGRSVFYDLNTVAIGARVTISLEDGSDSEFEVVEKIAYDSTSLPGQELFAREGDPRLALITCGGEWDPSAGRYTKTVVVYAEPATTN